MGRIDKVIINEFALPMRKGIFSASYDTVVCFYAVVEETSES